MRNFDFPVNSWAGVTITGLEVDLQRKSASIKHVRAPIKFISFEPLLKYPAGVILKGIDWVIIGAQTGPGAKLPDEKAVKNILEAAWAVGIPVFLKDNLRWQEVVREYPGGLKNGKAG